MISSLYERARGIVATAFGTRTTSKPTVAPGIFPPALLLLDYTVCSSGGTSQRKRTQPCGERVLDDGRQRELVLQAGLQEIGEQTVAFEQTTGEHDGGLAFVQARRTRDGEGGARERRRGLLHQLGRTTITAIRESDDGGRECGDASHRVVPPFVGEREQRVQILGSRRPRDRRRQLVARAHPVVRLSRRTKGRRTQRKARSLVTDEVPVPSATIRSPAALAIGDHAGSREHDEAVADRVHRAQRDARIVRDLHACARKSPCHHLFEQARHGSTPRTRDAEDDRARHEIIHRFFEYANETLPRRSSAENRRRCARRLDHARCTVAAVHGDARSAGTDVGADEHDGGLRLRRRHHSSSSTTASWNAMRISRMSNRPKYTAFVRSTIVRSRSGSAHTEVPTNPV